MNKANAQTAKELLRIGADKTVIQKLIVYILVMILASFIPPILSYFSKLILNGVTYALNNQNHDIQNYLILLMLISNIMIWINEFLTSIKKIENTYINYLTRKHIQNYIFNKLDRIKYDVYESADTFDLINRVCINAPVIYDALNFVILLLVALISTISYGVLLSTVEWYFIIIIIVPNLIYIYAESKNAFERYYLEINQTNDNRKINYLHTLFRDKKNSKEIRAFGLEQILINKYNKVRESLYRKGLKLLIKQSIMSFVLVLISKIGIFICLFIVTTNYKVGKNSIGDFALILSAGALLSSSVCDIFKQINNMSIRLTHLEDWENFLQLDEEVASKKNISGIDNILFSNVTYKYPNTNSYAINNVTCQIKKGESIALVGENGSGKSTFIKLLLGILEPSKGLIMINNYESSEVMNDFRNHVACVFQNFARYKMSIKDHIELVNPSQDIKELEFTFINFLSDLPEGDKTPLGNIDRNGVDLSGGQWQRIAIERALSRKNVGLYIMDEPSAALDPISESLLYEQFNVLLKGKTKIITSHRLGSCILADRIFVFDNGQIIESGTHRELMQKGGKYFSMYTAQRSLYAKRR
ncbi:ABC transporter ATP-binding protein [Clostridium sp.]|uniref:ABC transporter ATP-binding protein n=1 Tax=Clostridium sp. TaxID=1506 RepID=UPI003F330737